MTCKFKLCIEPGIGISVPKLIEILNKLTNVFGAEDLEWTIHDGQEYEGFSTSAELVITGACGSKEDKAIIESLPYNDLEQI